jgi:hypothetical protein
MVCEYVLSWCMLYRMYTHGRLPYFSSVLVIYCHSKLMWSKLLGYATYYAISLIRAVNPICRYVRARLSIQYVNTVTVRYGLRELIDINTGGGESRWWHAGSDATASDGQGGQGGSWSRAGASSVGAGHVETEASNSSPRGRARKARQLDRHVIRESKHENKARKPRQ